MSFAEKFKSLICQFVGQISQKYHIPEQELLQLWEKDSFSNVNSISPPAAEVSKETTSELNKMEKKELVALCKAKGLKVTGNKQDLIQRLTPGNVEAAKPKEEKKKVDVPVAAPATIIDKLQSTIKPIQIKKNAFGNFEHAETGFVFDKVTQKVIGRQNPTGSIDSLRQEDFELCHKFKFRYTIPENLNLGMKSNSVAIEGVEEEEDDSVEGAAEPMNEGEEEVIEEEEEIAEEAGEEFYEEED